MINNKYTPQNDLEQINQYENSYRLGFIRKVYSIFTMQIVATASFCAYAMYDPEYLKWQK